MLIAKGSNLYWRIHMLGFLYKGGVLVIPILLCSVFALAIFLERLIRFIRLRKQGRGLAEKVAAFVKNGDDKQARDLVDASESPMGKVLAQALEVKDQSQETLEAIIVHATEEEVRGLSRYLQALATIGNIAPLLGLFGTVVGMIKAFMVIQEMGGKVNAAVLAGGIWEAMLTTALGLAVALPTIIAHSYLVSEVNQSEARLQRGAITFLKAVISIEGSRVQGSKGPRG
jgi:biopolymer transport protein ExbB